MTEHEALLAELRAHKAALRVAINGITDLVKKYPNLAPTLLKIRDEALEKAVWND